MPYAYEIIVRMLLQFRKSSTGRARDPIFKIHNHLISFKPTVLILTLFFEGLLLSMNDVIKYPNKSIKSSDTLLKI